MSNVLEFPTRAPEPESPVQRRQTLAEAIESGRPPRHADYVFVVKFTEGVFIAPGTGFVVEANRVGDTLTLGFAGGSKITVKPDAQLVWYPAP